MHSMLATFLFCCKIFDANIAIIGNFVSNAKNTIVHFITCTTVSTDTFFTIKLILGKGHF